MSKYITAGCLIRRKIRRLLLRNGIEFTEDKGWFDSVFYLKCSDEVFAQVCKILSVTK